MFGGFIKLYGALEGSGIQVYVADIMPLRWSFEALVLLEYNSLTAINPNVRSIEDVIGFSSPSPIIPVPVLICMSVLFLFCTWGALSRRKGFER